MMDDLMAAMMGGGGAPRAARRRKGRDVGHALPVTLEDLYAGKSITLPREKDFLCKVCNGRGTNKPDVSGVCSSCHGNGAKIIHRQMGPMIQQMQVPCDVCSGNGVQIRPEDCCSTCGGKRIISKAAPLSVTVEPGMGHQTQIPFRGEGNESADVDIPGDIVVVLQQIKHDKFVREGDNLLMNKKISLAEALCGFQFVIPHLDGRSLLVRNKGGLIIKPGDKKCIQGQGMPLANRTAVFGDLIIEFDVEFPERLQTSQIEGLATALPQGTAMPPPTTNYATVHVDRMPLEQLRKDIEAEDEEDNTQGGVQCAQQ